MSDRQPTGGIDYRLIVVAAVVVLGALLWAAGVASAWLSGHPVPRGRALAGLLALAHPGDPSAAWSAPVGPPALYWFITAVVLALVGVLVYVGWRLWCLVEPKSSAGRFRSDGTATRREVRQAAGSKALLAHSATLRPSLARPRPADVGVRLGKSRGIECWVSVEDSTVVQGPPRSGKGLHLVIPMTLDAPGPVVNTSTRPDNVAVTLAARAERGPVMIFDPERLAAQPGSPRTLRWSLTRGCEQPQTAMTRAQALVQDASRSGVADAIFWRTQTISVVQGLLHAAALDGRSAADIFRWSHTAGAAKDAARILANDPKAEPGWGAALDAIIGMDERTRDSVWAMVANTFASLADSAVLAEVTPEPGAEFDPREFLTTCGTVYLLGTATRAAATATLVAALVEDLIDTARRMAARSPGQRLDPPLALVLDEAANYPLPSLPSLMSEGGGSGITTVAVLQSLAQARDRWGRDAAQAIWDAAIVKIILGGSANADDLTDLSRVIGEHEEREWSETHQSGSERSISSSMRRRPIFEPSELRRLAFGSALLLLRSAPPILMTLRPWTARADAAALRAARDAWERGAGGA